MAEFLHSESAILPPFEISVDAATGLLCAQVRGFWSIETVDRYTISLTSEIARLRRRGARVSVLIDAATMQSQAIAVGERFVGTWRALTDHPEDRAAIVVASALATMQFRRIYETDRCRIFSSRLEAEAWLRDQRTSS